MGARTRTPRSRWIEQGLAVLATGGPDAVRVEVLAAGLGVTKGGFYGQFADRGELLEAMLDTWERESVDDVDAALAGLDGDARTRILRAGLLTFHERLRAVDLAVRDWARRDPAVAARLRRVDNRRMAFLREQFAALGADEVEAEARGVLAFCLAVGHELLAADLVSAPRAEVLRAAMRVVSG
ncbi:TetR/AcrR family transcriptional regulator [Pseudonocardia humida]|uniref:TetR/AcrR family transcriptional regulator n=1 Tax=Pseudonocardia humida TaxID=2800819 RepID=A0ABT0ZWA3_9PSEU|nr:TetR/AcrR family transcriptional regulator [Pseudonocardia humida]MCO1655021.1 TetR/AcrR family transcriptional regulator [Pseudonocardia humida]